MLTRGQIAKILYANWTYEDGYGQPPSKEDWRDFECGAPLNPVGLTKANFLETADAILASVNMDS